MRLTLMEHLPGNEITFLHWHNCFELALCLDGTGIFIIGSEGIHSVSRDDVYILPPGILHYSRSSGDSASKWLWAYFDFPRLLTRTFPEMNLDFLEILSRRHYSKLIPHGGEFRELLLELYRNREDVMEVRAWGLLLAKRLKKLFDRLPAKERSMPQTAPAGTRTNPERIKKALISLNRNYSAKLSVPELARLCGMSENNFRRVFHATIGISPQQYLNQFRCAMAKSFLCSGDAPITEIAWKCGYSTLSSFNRQFQKHIGMSPRAFRKLR